MVLSTRQSPRPAENISYNDNREISELTNTGVDNVAPYGAFEETRAAVTAEHTIVLPIGLVITH